MSVIDAHHSSKVREQERNLHRLIASESVAKNGNMIGGWSF